MQLRKRSREHVRERAQTQDRSITRFLSKFSTSDDVGLKSNFAWLEQTLGGILRASGEKGRDCGEQ